MELTVPNDLLFAALALKVNMRSLGLRLCSETKYFEESLRFDGKTTDWQGPALALPLLPWRSEPPPTRRIEPGRRVSRPRPTQIPEALHQNHSPVGRGARLALGFLGRDLFRSRHRAPPPRARDPPPNSLRSSRNACKTRRSTSARLSFSTTTAAIHLFSRGRRDLP